MHMRSITPKLTRKVAFAGKGQFSSSPILHPLGKEEGTKTVAQLAGLLVSQDLGTSSLHALVELSCLWALSPFTCRPARQPVPPAAFPSLAVSAWAVRR